MSESDFTGPEFPPLSDVLEAHLRQCKECQASLKAPPVPNVVQPHMTRTRLCSEWFTILKEYAQFEGKVNNVVAKTETGTEAWHQERLFDDQ